MHMNADTVAGQIYRSALSSLTSVSYLIVNFFFLNFYFGKLNTIKKKGINYKSI